MEQANASPIRYPVGAGAIVALGLTAAASQPASAASARNFFSPGYLGQPLAFCLDGQTSCGKPAATAWCQTNGYDEALSFARRTMADGEQAALCRYGQPVHRRQLHRFPPDQVLQGLAIVTALVKLAAIVRYATPR
jgi:hypothetical protein